MKIAIDCRFLYAAGLGRYISETVPRIVSRKPEWLFYLVCPNEHDFGVLSGNKSNATGIFSDTGMYSIKEQWELPVKVPATDIYWSPHYPIPMFGTRSKLQVTTIHDVNHLAFIAGLPLIQRAYARWMMRISTRKSDLILTVSHFSKQEIIKYTGISAEKIEPVYIGIDHNKFRKRELSTSERTALRNKYRLPERFILFVGNVKPHKNITGLIKAFELLHKQMPCVELVITGKKDKLINGVAGLGKMLQDLKLSHCVHFTGFVDDNDLPLLYNQAAVFVFPSFYEGFGLPPLEAMACGCPVVASDFSCIPEICGDAVYYVNPHSFEEIAEGLLKVLESSDLAAELIRKGFQQAENYNWEHAVTNVIRIFDRIVKP